MSEEARSTVEPGLIHRWLKFPLLEREDCVALAERINNSSSANVDFAVMMTLAAALASLGLMQGSTAVVIGAMLNRTLSDTPHLPCAPKPRVSRAKATRQSLFLIHWRQVRVPDGPCAPVFSPVLR